MTSEPRVPKEKDLPIGEAGLSFGQIKEIMCLMKKEGISHFRMGEGANRLSIARDKERVYQSNNEIERQICAEDRTRTEAEEETRVRNEEIHASGHVVTSPVVGVFYDSPAPDQEPYVSVGSYVNKGDVLCIIEAMKLMNEVTSPVSGVVKEILVTKASRVEFGHKLFVIELGAQKETTDE